MNNNIKLAIGSLIAFIAIISTIITASSMLKDEAVNNYLTISKLNAKAFSKELNQDLNNIEQTIKNISSILDLKKYTDLNTRLKDIQRNYPQVRSLNIIKDNIIIHSSNKLNIGLTINQSNFFPKPIFDDDILKISTPWIGRDFIDGNDVYTFEDKINDKDSFFIPISKKVNSLNGEFTVIVNLNNDYFINRFLTSINSDKIIFKLIRLDAIELLSTINEKAIGKKIKNTNLLDRTIEINEITEIEIINNTKYISTYILTENYPIALLVRLDYDKNLLEWNKTQSNFFIITILIIVVTMLIALYLFYLYNNERKKELELHKLQIQEKEKFEFLFQDSHFIASVISENGKILEINDTALKFLNTSLEKVKGIDFWNLSCWDFDEKIYLKKAFQEGEKEKNLSIELKAFNNKKEISTIDFNLSTINKESFFNYIVIGQDITIRKQREEKLTQAYTVFNNTNDGIMITDKYSNILEVNKSFEKITGYSKDNILNKNTRILKSNVHNTSFYEEMWNNIVKFGFWEGEITNCKKDGSFYTEWLTINVIYDENKKVKNYIGIFSDITEQKNKEEQLKENEKLIYQQSKMAAMGEMIENIAHQWRQPLSVISTAATGMKLQKELTTMSLKEEFKCLDTINESAQYLSNTIEDFRGYMNNNNTKEKFDISKNIDYSLKLLSSKLTNSNINIVKNYSPAYIFGIKNEFVQVIINIINNAKEALESTNKEEKIILIESYMDEDNVTIYIKDNAGGVPKAIIDRVFEPYFTTKHQSQGTGIGLYMSSEIIKNHMLGTLDVENKPFLINDKKYEGAVFTIKIPIN